MYDYLLINSVCVLGLLVLLGVRGRFRLIFQRRWLGALGVLLLLTAVFDNLLIQAGLVTYTTAHILGIKLWHAPAEDFLYSIAALLLMTLLWKD